MEQNKITQGKWQVCDHGQGLFISSPNEYGRICTMNNRKDYPKDELRATAEAIASLPSLISENEKLRDRNKELVEAFQGVRDFLISENNTVRDYLNSKNDVGQLDMKTDPIQSLSFSRGKNAAFCISIEAVNKALSNNQ